MRDDYARFGNRQGSSDSPSRRRNQDPRDANSHPGMANYPTGGAQRDPRRAGGSSNRYLPPLGEERRDESRRRPRPEREIPPKLTVTRVAAMRSREMGSRMYGLFHKAATALKWSCRCRVAMCDKSNSRFAKH